MGQQGVAVFTSDGGRSWQPAVPCTSRDLFDLTIDSTGTWRRAVGEGPNPNLSPNPNSSTACWGSFACCQASHVGFYGLT